MHETAWTRFDQSLARRLDDALVGAGDHDPVDADVLPGGALGNHGVDVELTGLRARAWHDAGDERVLRGHGGSGWHLGPLGHRELYPRVGEVELRASSELIEPGEDATLRAWADEGVPVRLRGMVGAAPVLVLDDGHRTVVLSRPGLAWSITAD